VRFLQTFVVLGQFLVVSVLWQQSRAHVAQNELLTGIGSAKVGSGDTTKLKFNAFGNHAVPCSGGRTLLFDAGNRRFKVR